MKIFRNSSFTRIIAFCVICVTVFSIIGFCFNMTVGILILLCGLILCSAFLLYERTQYGKIEQLSLQIDEILHDNDSICFEDYSEGELAILQSELRKMTIRLREQKRNLQKDKIYLADSIADISHQIRTPLTSINLIVSMLSEENVSEEQRLHLTRELTILLSRIDRLITALLKLSKLEAGTVTFNPETIGLSDLIERSVQPLAVLLELHGISLTVNACGNFSGDVLWSSEAIGNIVKNCMEHTPEGGQIKIRAQENALYSEIVIEDNGKGIDSKDLPHIFERFYKGKDSGNSGFGIGLALARTIVVSQNGTLSAANGQDCGAVFTMRFYKGAV